MSDETGSGGTRPPDEDLETGEPIEVLSRVTTPPSAGFLSRLRGKLHRRSFTGQIAVLSWELPKLLLWEFLDLLFHLVRPGDARGGDER